MLTEEYFRKHEIHDLKTWEASVVCVHRRDWDEEKLDYMSLEAEYLPREDPRVLMSWELWHDADVDHPHVSKSTEHPIVGSTFTVGNLTLEIVGYKSRFTTLSYDQHYDIVLKLL